MGFYLLNPSAIKKKISYSLVHYLSWPRLQWTSFLLDSKIYLHTDRSIVIDTRTHILIPFDLLGDLKCLMIRLAYGIYQRLRDTKIVMTGELSVYIRSLLQHRFPDKFDANFFSVAVQILLSGEENICPLWNTTVNLTKKNLRTHTTEIIWFSIVFFWF